MRLLQGILILLVCAMPCLGAATLSYTGADLSAGTGTMTITCTDSGSGQLWSLDLLRQTGGFVASIVKFDDLKDGGNYNYADANTAGTGLFLCHDKSGSFGGSSYNATFSQVHKGTDYYSYRLTIVKSTNGVHQWRQVATYKINPATTTDSLFTCQVVTTNITGQNQTSTAFMSGIFQAYCSLNANPCNYNQGGRMSAYQGSAPAFIKQLQTAGGADAIWKVTDNLNAANPERAAGQAAWGKAEVLSDSISQGQNLIAARSFMLSSDVNNNETAATSFSAGLSTVSQYPLEFIIAPVNWGFPSTWNAGASYTHNYTLDINISTAGQPLVSIPGADRAVMDTNGTGNMSVTLSGSASTGTITSYTWYDNGSTTALATGVSPTVSLPLGINDMKLTVAGPSGSNSAVQRVWVYQTPTYWVDGLNGNDANPGTSQAAAFKTIGKGTSKAVAGNLAMVLGTTVYRQNPSTTNSGTPTSPITLMGMPLQRVIVDGSDLVTGWTQCPSNLNSNYQKIWTATITRTNHPTQATQTLNGVETELMASGLPANCSGGPPYVGGRNVCTGGTTTTIVDSNLIGQYPDNYFNGASVNFDDAAGHGISYGSLLVTGFTSSTGTLTLNASVGKTPVAGQDGYCVYNMPQLLNGPGQFAVVSNGGTSYTVYVWMTDGSNPASSGRQIAINGNRNSGIIVGVRSYWTIDNFEVRHVWSSEGGGSSNALGWNPCGDGTVIRNCLSHHNDGNGIIIGGSSGAVISHCTSTYCRYPISINATAAAGGSVTVDHCEAAYSWEDGLRPSGASSANTNTLTVDSCYVHDINGFNHSDGMQSVGLSYLGTLNFQNCLEFNNFDGWEYSMGNGSQYLTTCNFNNNVFIGMKGTVFQAGGATLNVTKNTCAGAAGASFDWGSTTTNGTWLNNVVFNGQMVGKCLGVPTKDINGNPTTDNSDYNDWFMRLGESDTPVVWHGDSYLESWATYKADSGQDSHSYDADPLFTNFPTYYLLANDSLTWTNTPTKVHIVTTPQSYLTFFAVGDNIEIGCDGVMRTVQSIGSDYITFSPAKNDMVLSPIQGIGNFKMGTNPAFNLAFKSGSPAIGHSSTGGNMGSTINIANYMNGDFNGDGRRDIPAYPPTMPVPPG